jgi:hypothetical protein
LLKNDHLKREVKKLKLEVNKLKKQAKVQPPQDNHSNVVNKLEKEKRIKDCFSTLKEYARSVFLNARRPHIKNETGYKNDDKHNSRVNTKGQEFIKFTKANAQ